ncbi:hypothetical protein, partial [Bacillus cereus]|uniref:hypothetical protein n=1 Tax=Bacillus cereus TaxID=1396 RepID=UPI0034D40DB4
KSNSLTKLENNLTINPINNNQKLKTTLHYLQAHYSLSTISRHIIQPIEVIWPSLVEACK